MSVDYRYTHTGQETARKYADIINLPRPQMKYQRMDPVKRAKIFAPFDAPRSIEPTTEAVKEKANQVERIYLSRGSEKELKLLGWLVGRLGRSLVKYLISRRKNRQKNR